MLVEGYETTHDAKTIGEIFHEDFSHIRKDHAPDNSFLASLCSIIIISRHYYISGVKG